ncbi:MAG: hypothetical protein BHV78_05715 [Bacteroides sp. CAG:1060_57_27]|nr:MAG: hypothetical protein BHV78_05715 [Bacteroides sp. CAG:1060_57_27]
MKAGAFIAGRLGFKGKMAVAATAISFFVIILALSISSGFSRQIRAGVASLTGDVVLKSSYSALPTDTAPISESPSYLPDILALPGVEKVEPAIYCSGIIRREGDITGVIFKGVEREGMQSLGAVVPAELARGAGIAEGESLTAYFAVSGRMKIRRFTVEGTYDTPVSTGLGYVVYVPMQDLRRVLGWGEGEVSALEVTLDGNLRSSERMRREAARIGIIADGGASGEDEMAACISAADSYAAVFDWLDLIDVNVYAILLLMTLVAGFNMVSGLLILLFRNISTIGTLKSLGMTDRAVAGVFLRIGARIAAKGMAVGNALALLFCLIQGSTHLIRLNPANYYLSYVPVHIDIGRILIADAASFIVIMLLLLIPSLFISNLDPASTVKTE